MVTACSQAPSPSGQAPGTSQQTAPQTQASTGPKIVVVSISEDPKNFWDGINGGGGSGARELGHLVNQYLAILKTDGTPEPRLLAELPSQDKGTWKVNADGTMDVTYKLRPGVTWHDGSPFTADDVVFSWQVDKDPAIPNGNQGAVRLIKDMVATDPQTAVATWSGTYPFADRLEHREFYPLPKHILAESYATNKENFIANPYFTDEYVGTGPFKVAKWDHGSSLDLVANDNYFLGRPKLDRIRVEFIGDPNTLIANLRAGAVNVFFPPGGPTFDDLQPLAQQWATDHKGTLVTESVRWVYVESQKGSIAQLADLRDNRVRQALLMDIDRKELATTLLGNLGIVADSWVSPNAPYYAQVKDTITQYPFDPKRAQTQLADLGWTPGSDGVLQKNGQRFQFQLRHQTEREKDATVIRDSWKSIGVDASLDLLTSFQLRDAEYRANFTGASIDNNPVGGLSAVRRFATDQIPTAANKYAGTNRGQFNNADWDRIGDSMRVALQDSQRLSLEGDLLRVFTNELPSLPLYFEIQALPVAGFTGVQGATGIAHTGNIMHTTNAHLWDLS
ncbi:MAG: peptide/nickel transport system substrate-binding protein [Chloroflexota bacterium]|nr:peptide/nickel transport system substrate-binding protein [Chloroflexota bacterium]